MVTIYERANTMISEAEAFQSIITRVEPVAQTSSTLAGCVGRYAAKTYRATLALPTFDNSAMDGYAMKRQMVERGRG